MIIAAFNEKDTYVTIYGLYQYDYGQVLRIQGLNLPSAVEMHFALQDKGGESITRVGTTKDGVTDVLIPDSMLENNGTSSDYKIYVFVYIADEISGKTERRIEMSVKSRPKPEAFDRPEDTELFRDAIKAVNESAARSAESERQAEGWAHGREDLPEREQDNAKYYSEQAKEDSAKTDADRKEVERLVESVSGVDEQVETIRGYLEQAQTSATNAALSESAAKESENNAAQARAGAEVAEDNAELAAQKTGQDKTAVEKAANLVKQISQEVLDNKNLVDDTVHEFEMRTQQAVADVNNAGQTQTERVQTAGNTAVESVESAQRTATGAVETAKIEAIKTVQEEGVAQTGTVAAEGEKQVQAVQAAASEIVADRQQIQKNAVDIESLGHNKADAIVSSASGEQIVLTDSDNESFKGSHVYGKSTQVTTTGANLLPFIVGTKGVGFEVFDDGIWINAGANVDVYAVGKNDSLVESGYSEYDLMPPGDYWSYIDNSELLLYIVVWRDGKSVVLNASNGSVVKNTILDGDKFRLFIRTKNAFTGKVKAIISKAPINPDLYEPYTGGKPSPSIEYPQEIVSVGDKGEIGVSVYGGNLIPETQIVDVSFNKKEEPQILTLKTPNGLSGIPVPTGGNYTDSNGKQWVCDEIDFGRGKYVQRVKKIFVNGNCKKEKEQSNGLYRAAYIDNSLSDNVTGILCDKLFMSEDLFTERCTQGYGRIYLSIFLNRLKNGENSTEEDLNEFLRENPLTFLCVLKRPIERDLTQEEVETYKALHTNYPTTVIMNDENAGMKVSYVADTKHYIDKKFKELNQAIVNTQISLL